METLPEIVFEGMPPSDAVKARIEAEIEKLARFHDRITACRVVITAPHRHHHKGKLYDARIHLTLPGQRDVVVGGSTAADHSHEDVYVAIRDAFQAARRQLQTHVRKLDGKVKAHEVPPVGRVARLFPDQGYGFIEAPDKREVYFHRNSVRDDGFDQLSVGSGVVYVQEEGEDGPQASMVRPVGSGE